MRMGIFFHLRKNSILFFDENNPWVGMGSCFMGLLYKKLFKKDKRTRMSVQLKGGL